MTVSFETPRTLIIEIVKGNNPIEVRVTDILSPGLLNLVLYELVDQEQNRWSIVATMAGLSRADRSGVSLRIHKLNNELENLDVEAGDVGRSTFFPGIQIKGH